MKSILIAAATVGATIAGLILYTERKMKRRSALPRSAKEAAPSLPEDKIQPLAIHSIP